MGKASCHEFAGHKCIRVGNFEICILITKHTNTKWIRTEQRPFCKQSSRNPKQYYIYVTIIHVCIQTLKLCSRVPKNTRQVSQDYYTNTYKDF